MRINQELEDVIYEQSMFEDSALEDASAYARMITTGAERFKKENNRFIKENNNGTDGIDGSE